MTAAVWVIGAASTFAVLAVVDDLIRYRDRPNIHGPLIAVASLAAILALSILWFWPPPRLEGAALITAVAVTVGIWVIAVALILINRHLGRNDDHAHRH